MKKAALHNLGCKVNAYETEAMQQMLEQAGYEIVPFDEKADVYVINTCSVTNIADRKSRQMLRRARKQNPKAVIVGAGCYVQAKTDMSARDLTSVTGCTAESERTGKMTNVKEDGLWQEEYIDIVIGNNKKYDLIHLLEEYAKSGKKQRNVCDINKEKQRYEELKRERTISHTRAFLKVQDGCNQFCSYCIIPFARGRIRSRTVESVLCETEKLAENGCREIVLTGIHLSSYGCDTGDTLLHLIEEIHKVDGICRIRLGSLEPRIITKDFTERLASFDKICPHFHLSLQSGCDSVLTRMNRRYTTAEYKEGCDLLRRYFSHPAITTDVIVGFPGETQQEFEVTKQYLAAIRFYEMHIFKYSAREGTKAAAMSDQIPEEKKALRSNELIALGNQMSAEFREYYTGRRVTALLEEEFLFEGKRYMTGYTAEYVKTAFETNENLQNTLVSGIIKQHLTADLYLLVEF